MERCFGPKAADHPSVGKECHACHSTFAEGDLTTLVMLGPGGDEEARREAAAGHAYTGVAIEIHWACATGRTDAP
jgi:hypothetical protein